MAVPAYTNDLTDWIADSDTTAWGELDTMVAGGNPDEVDTESALQGTNSCSQTTNTTSLFSMCRILASPKTLNTNDVFLVWHCHSVATALLSYASGGLRLFVANSLTNWKGWAVGGNDVPPYPYGNWINNAFDPSVTGEYSNGTAPTGLSFYGVGSGGILSQVVARGQPHKVDIIRYGRAQARFTGGESANYAKFSGFAAANDATAARWGLIQATAGGYLWKGLMLIGLSTVATTFRARASNVATLTTGAAHGFKVGDTLTMTGIGGSGYNVTATVTTVPTTTTFTYANTGADEGSTADTGGSINGVCDFRDSNTTVFVQDTRKVYATFNKIEVRNASTNVDWSGISIVNLSPSTTASKGDFEVIDNATVVLASCNFTDLGTFIFLGNSDATNCQFLRCGKITGGGGLFNDTRVLTPTVAADEGAFFYNQSADPNGELDNMTFSKGTNAHHAIDFGTNVTSALGNITLTGCEFTGFGSTADSNDSTVRFLATSGALTLNLVGCTVNGASATTSNFSVDDAAGITVTVSISVPITVTVKDTAGDPISGVQTAVYLTSDRTEVMNEDTVAGVASASFGGTTPAECEVRCRKASIGATKYIPFSSIQTIQSSTGLSLAVTLREDPNNNATE